MEIDDPDLSDIKDLINELINKVTVRELDSHYHLSDSRLCEILNETNFNESLLELDEHFRAMEEITADDVNQFFVTHTKCDACKTKSSLFWRRVAREKIVCNDCFFEKAYLILFDDEHQNKKIKLSDSSSSSSYNSKQSSVKNKNKKTLNNQNPKQKAKLLTQTNRPLTRTTTNLKSQLSSSSSSSLATEDLRKSPRINQASHESEIAGNRRNRVFKKSTPSRNEVLVSKLNTSDYVFHRGFYIQVGDIVALRDKEDLESIYFAQIRAFLSDQFGQKSAIITWLIPVDENYKQIKSLKDFDPALFELGPAEEFPRSLDCMEFVARLDKNPMINYDLDYFKFENKFKNDLLRHKFELEDLANRNFSVITKKYYAKASEVLTEHEIKI